MASPDPVEEVQGSLLERLTPDEWRLLDDFEDDVYDLVPLLLTDGRTGWSYVCLDQAVATSERWEFDDFARRDLTAYVANCRAWLDRRGDRRLADTT